MHQGRPMPTLPDSTPTTIVTTILVLPNYSSNSLAAYVWRGPFLCVVGQCTNVWRLSCPSNRVDKALVPPTQPPEPNLAILFSRRSPAIGCHHHHQYPSPPPPQHTTSLDTLAPLLALRRAWRKALMSKMLLEYVGPIPTPLFPPQLMSQALLVPFSHLAYPPPLPILPSHHSITTTSQSHPPQPPHSSLIALGLTAMAAKLPLPPLPVSTGDRSTCSAEGRCLRGARRACAAVLECVRARRSVWAGVS